MRTSPESDGNYQSSLYDSLTRQAGWGQNWWNLWVFPGFLRKVSLFLLGRCWAWRNKAGRWDMTLPVCQGFRSTFPGWSTGAWIAKWAILRLRLNCSCRIWWDRDRQACNVLYARFIRWGSGRWWPWIWTPLVWMYLCRLAGLLRLRTQRRTEWCSLPGLLVSRDISAYPGLLWNTQMEWLFGGSNTWRFQRSCLGILQQKGTWITSTFCY